MARLALLVVGPANEGGEDDGSGGSNHEGDGRALGEDTSAHHVLRHVRVALFDEMGKREGACVCAVW